MPPAAAGPSDHPLRFEQDAAAAIQPDAPRPATLDKAMPFDAQAYLAANPDVATSGLDPLTHFRLIGDRVRRRDVSGAMD